ncbi:MAG: hypothetical protein KDD62_11425, partial [Bdellovibrionales bacterium]|nr:hypothetical protein [Bdellovibrionales bacterium]
MAHSEKPFDPTQGTSLASFRSAKSIAKKIFKADVPEEYVQALPDQTLYSVLKLNGVSSSADLISILNSEQIRHLLDFDLWNRDQFSEDNFFEWLAVCDSVQELSLLEHVLSGVDFKLVAYLMSKYVEIHIQTEATDDPPDIGFRSPDRGYTWLKIECPNADYEFLIGRLMAQIFESSSELFYQLIGVTQNTTSAELEEESYQDKLKRLASIGIPEPELASEIHQPLYQVVDDNKEPQITHTRREIQAVEPLLYSPQALQPLESLIDAMGPDSNWQ